MKNAKQGLQNGCLVQFRNNDVMMYVETSREKGFINPKNTHHMTLDGYDDDLKFLEEDEYDEENDWDIIAYTIPLGLVGLKMDWEEKFDTKRGNHNIAWKEPLIDYSRRAILRQDWISEETGRREFRIVQTTGAHAKITFSGYTLFDSEDEDSDPFDYCDTYSKAVSYNDNEDYTLKLIKYI